ncbi:MAG: 50S ribosomal protein L32 [Deltaproteobacteria bacterium]|nr:50S ribosomal protein L32 [Deltaproteobacteria bacterium]
MSLPKRRVSKSKRNMRRSHDRLYSSSLSVCPRCRSPKLPHRVCIHCGYYRDREVIKMDQV